VLSQTLTKSLPILTLGKELEHSGDIGVFITHAKKIIGREKNGYLLLSYRGVYTRSLK
jgi:hypothetical protein